MPPNKMNLCAHTRTHARTNTRRDDILNIIFYSYQFVDHTTISYNANSGHEAPAERRKVVGMQEEINEKPKECLTTCLFTDSGLFNSVWNDTILSSFSLFISLKIYTTIDMNMITTEVFLILSLLRLAIQYHAE